jgi:hypothetical protein
MVFPNAHIFDIRTMYLMILKQYTVFFFNFT